MSKLKLRPPDPEMDRKQEAARDLALRIGHKIISVLGRPAEFAKIVVVRLWENTHRVNVLTGSDPTSMQIADSFFVVVDDDGDVIESSPPLVRRYGTSASPAAVST